MSPEETQKCADCTKIKAMEKFAKNDFNVYSRVCKLCRSRSYRKRMAAYKLKVAGDYYIRCAICEHVHPKERACVKCRIRTLPQHPKSVKKKAKMLH